MVMKKWLSILMAVLMLTMTAGCSQSEQGSGEAVPPADSSKDSTPAGENGELEKLTISVHPSGHGLPAYIASEKGWFEENGLDVEMLVYISAAPQMEAYTAGAWELGTTGFGGIVLGVAKNDLQIIGASIDDADIMAYWAREDSPIALAGKGHIPAYPEIYGTSEEWRGKEVLFMQGTTMEVLLSATLDALELTNDDIIRTNMDKAAAFTAFSSGSADLVQADASFYFNALNEGWVPVSTSRAMDLFMPSALIASDSIIKEKPEVVQKWLDAYMRAVDWIKENPEEAAEMFAEFCEENGVATTEENALNFVNMQVVNIPDVAEQMELFAKAEGSDATNWQLSLGKLMDYYSKAGSYTEEDKELLLKLENYNSTFMGNVG